MRGVVGVPELPGAAVALLGLLTQLGDAWFLLLLLGTGYWLAPRELASDPRRTGAALIGLALSGLALTIGLKSAFALPRPPGAGEATATEWLPALLRVAYADAVTGDGFGFPSGHAVAATVVYGGAAWLLDRVDRRRRLLGGAAVVLVVDLSRVALGVHYLLDVVAGTLLALAFLWATLRAGAVRPGRAFALAAALSTAALAVALARAHPASTAEAAMTLGAAVGGLLGWRFTAVRSPDAPVSPPVGIAALAVAGGTWGAVYLLETPVALALVAGAAATWLLVSLPSIAADVGTA